MHDFFSGYHAEEHVLFFAGVHAFCRQSGDAAAQIVHQYPGQLVLPVIPLAVGDLLLTALYGGVVMGVGIGLVFLSQATTGGTDLMRPEQDLR